MRRLAAILVMAVGSCALAGPEWPEGGDAGSLPGSAQPISNGGGGVVTKIIGRLEGPPGMPHRGIGDFQDMYRINIVDPMLFSASTSAVNGGSADFDSSLWLFNLDGTAILGNLEYFLDPSSSRITGQSTDGTGAMIVTPGEYLLAISCTGSDPLGGPGFGPMFEFVLPDEVSGPDGPGGLNNQIVGWSEGDQFGNYEIALHGVEFIVPAPAGAVAFSGLLFAGLRRRR